MDIELSDGTFLACIAGDAKGDEAGSNANGINHAEGSIFELLSCTDIPSSEAAKANPNKNDILHGCDI